MMGTRGALVRAANGDDAIKLFCEYTNDGSLPQECEAEEIGKAHALESAKVLMFEDYPNP